MQAKSVLTKLGIGGMGLLLVGNMTMGVVILRSLGTMRQARQIIEKSLEGVETLPDGSVGLRITPIVSPIDFSSLETTGVDGTSLGTMPVVIQPVVAPVSVTNGGEIKGSGSGSIRMKISSVRSGRNR